MAKKLDHRAIRLANERSLVNARALLEGKNFASVDEANAYMQEVFNGSGPLPDIPLDTPLKRAQQVAYDAMEATGSRRMELARRALDISPDCADAWVLLAEDDAKTPKQTLEYARKAVAAGERALGKEYFEQEEAGFWEDVYTRPYMRAMMTLAGSLWATGERDEAIDVFQKMLRLNPQDNQGVRHVLANLFAVAGRDDVFEALIEEYDGDPLAAFRYSKALWLFRTSGAGPDADGALEEAMEGNPYVPQYLLGRRRLPAQVPDYHGLGDRSEAVAYVSGAREGWVVTKDALAWLKARYLAWLDS